MFFHDYGSQNNDGWFLKSVVTARGLLCRKYVLTYLGPFFTVRRSSSCELFKVDCCFYRLLDTVQLGLTIQGLYHYLVTNFGNFTVIMSPTM